MLDMFKNLKCPHCGNRVEPTGYSVGFPQYRCRYCIRKNRKDNQMTDRMAKLEARVAELEGE